MTGAPLSRFQDLLVTFGTFIRVPIALIGRSGSRVGDEGKAQEA